MSYVSLSWESYNGKYFSERPELKQEMSLNQVKETLERLKDSEVSIIDLTPSGEFLLIKIGEKCCSLFLIISLKSQSRQMEDY